MEGEGEGVYGEIVPKTNASAAVHGRTHGTGPGVLAISDGGRGVVAQGKRAQVRLLPSTLATHPTSGEAGDLFVDEANRLWFCHGGTVWKQLA